MITVNPLVTAHTLLPESAFEAFKHEPALSGPAPVYSITDDMSATASSDSGGGSWRGGWAKRFVPDAITYQACFLNREDGMLTITHAPMGVRSVTTWLVKEGGEGGLVLEERGEVTSNRMLMGFIKTTLQESHDKLVRDFVKVLEKEVEEGKHEL